MGDLFDSFAPLSTFPCTCHMTACLVVCFNPNLGHCLLIRMFSNTDDSFGSYGNDSHFELDDSNDELSECALRVFVTSTVQSS